MVRWFASLKLSLRGKFQLLFGLAIALVILAAVIIPWLRMEELTNALNERSAQCLINNAIDEHVAYYNQQQKGQPLEVDGFIAWAWRSATRPTTQALSAGPATRSATTQAARARQIEYGPVAMMLFRDLSKGANLIMRRTITQVQRQPSVDYYSKLSQQEDNTYRYRYGRVLYMENRCADCHSSVSGPPAGVPLPSNAIGLVSVEFPSQVDRNQTLLNRIVFFSASLAAGTIGVIFIFVIISRFVLQPVRVLQETAEKVSDGDLNIRTHIHSGDEFQVLSETFNRMLENLKASEDQLRAINQTLDVKLAELSESNLALYESNRLKSEFLANVSHELRTPLNSILGFAELLKDVAKADQKSSRYVQNIMTSGRSLLELINDLLDLAKIEAGKMDVRPLEVSLSDMFEGLASVLRPLLEPKGLTIRTQLGNDVPLMYTDAGKLQQILYNFLSNAIKFSPAGGQIELIAQRQDDDRVKITVIDHGQGIAADKQPIIFEKFRQIDGSHTRQYGGSGLGLAISRDLTQLLGGKIGLESVLGQGASFWIELPIRIETAEEAKASP